MRQDREINRLNREIFRLAIEIGDDPDTREWAMHMILVARALERIGDNAVDIGEQVAFVVTGLFREFSDSSRPPGSPPIPPRSQPRKLLSTRPRGALQAPPGPARRCEHPVTSAPRADGSRSDRLHCASMTASVRADDRGGEAGAPDGQASSTRLSPDRRPGPRQRLHPGPQQAPRPPRLGAPGARRAPCRPMPSSRCA